MYPGLSVPRSLRKGRHTALSSPEIGRRGCDREGARGRLLLCWPCFFHYWPGWWSNVGLLCDCLLNCKVMFCMYFWTNVLNQQKIVLSLSQFCNSFFCDRIHVSLICPFKVEISELSESTEQGRHCTAWVLSSTCPSTVENLRLK